VKAAVKATLHAPATTVVGPAHVIADIAKNNGSDLIVLGTRGHSAVAGLLLGSVTQRLLHIAPCPVLAVPPASHAVL
jgi:nucleotide-binding universal stress UspA family protein